MKPQISIIIPCFNAETTIEQCLSGIYQTEECNFEVIVVDDYSSDNSIKIIHKFPCRLIQLKQHRGAAYARNTGAAQAKADRLFFTDADCVLQKQTLDKVLKSLANSDENVIIGGSYSQRAYDNRFFSHFQSIFIHYAETKHPLNPDYIATHALAMSSALFHLYAGFSNHTFPILEDVEYSHRLKIQGVKLSINPEIQVQHIFNFSLLRSLQNALRKSKYWTAYTIKNKDLLADSGTASYELKVNTLACITSITLLGTLLFTPQPMIFAVLLLTILGNLSLNFRFILTIYRAFALSFTLTACLYYFCIYPLAVIFGSLLGIAEFMRLRYQRAEYT